MTHLLVRDDRSEGNRRVARRERPPASPPEANLYAGRTARTCAGRVLRGTVGPVHAGSPAAVKVALFGALFTARTDVQAIRWENVRSGKAGWVPAVRGGWRKGTPHAERDYLPLTPEILTAPLSGQAQIGLYPLLDRDQCWWLAADFDGPAMLDALAYLKAHGHW